MSFSSSTRAHLGHYVYALVEPGSNTIFYVGKASGNNRAFNHLAAKHDERKKQRRIHKIRAAGNEPTIEILRYGLTSAKAAHEVEAAVIDSLGLENLTNEVRGHGVARGRLTAKEAERLHGAKPVEINTIREPSMLFFLNQTYSPTLTEQQLYDCTRQFWSRVSVQSRTPGVSGLPYKVAFAIADSVVVRVYSIAAWLRAGTTLSTRPYDGDPSDQKWEFVGNLLPTHALLGRQLNSGGKPLPANQLGYGYIRAISVAS
jgi:hypothetical protein